METLSQITRDDEARRLRAHRLERALSEKVTQDARRVKLTAALAQYEDSLATLDTLSQFAALVDPVIDCGGSLRIQLVQLIARGHTDQQRRADDTRRRLTQNETEAVQTAAVLAELQS